MLAGFVAHAETLPSLPGLATPEEFNGNTAADTVFARKLEKMGNLNGAITEWQRAAYLSSDPVVQEQAAFKVAQLHRQQGSYDKALDAYQSFGAQFPQSVKIPQALYELSVMTLGRDPALSKAFTQRLQKNYPNTQWSTAATYQQAWQQAQQGHPLLNVQSEQGKQLAKRLNELPQINKQRAVLFSIIPGAGHAFLGDTQTAAMAFGFNILFLAAFVYALRQRHYPYAVVWGLIFAILYSGTFFSTRSLAEREIKEARLAAMDSWEDLKPSKPQL